MCNIQILLGMKDDGSRLLVQYENRYYDALLLPSSPMAFSYTHIQSSQLNRSYRAKPLQVESGCLLDLGIKRTAEYATVTRSTRKTFMRY